MYTRVQKSSAKTD